MVREHIERMRPAAVLIEGPVEFNERIDELYLDHTPPISIYSYVAWEDGRRQGAYYPLCEYSPEWQAIVAARACGAAVRFIDLPFATLAAGDGRIRHTHLYADDQLRGSHYVGALCERLGVENFDDAWDLIAEQDPSLSADEVLRRTGEYCTNLRQMDGDAVRESDSRREEFMAANVRAAGEEFGMERVIAITGGYHTNALETLLANDAPASDPVVEWPDGIAERGIALTPYSYERLDNLTGYDAGMPSPGFYHEAWRSAGEVFHPTLLARIATELRDKKQIASTADLIAVEASALALATLRGHVRVWRRDLVDAVISALVKDDLHASHPFLLATQAVLRGGERGRLAKGSPLPPLVEDMLDQLAAAKLTPTERGVERKLALADARDLVHSRMLHRLRLLAIEGIDRTGGVDFAARDDLSSLTETWKVRWRPEQDAAMIEASRYGSAIGEAAAARLREQADQLERSAADAALLLLDAVLAGVLEIAEALRSKLSELIRKDGGLHSVAQAMDHLLFLYGWDDTLGARGSAEAGALLEEAFDRALWLLESGNPAPTAADEVEAVRVTRDVFERAESPMGLDRDHIAEILLRVQSDSNNSPAMRGASAGALWSLHRADPEHILRDLRLFADPEQLGDFLNGLFSLAREESQRESELLRAVGEVVGTWDDEQFLAALPSLRLAFMAFTAREKTFIGETLFPLSPEQPDEPEPPTLSVSTADAAVAMAFESKLLQLAETYGVRLEPAPEATSK